MSETLIEAVNLKKYFSTNAGVVHAVDDVSFKINAGETLLSANPAAASPRSVGLLSAFMTQPKVKSCIAARTLPRWEKKSSAKFKSRCR